MVNQRDNILSTAIIFEAFSCLFDIVNCFMKILSIEKAWLYGFPAEPLFQSGCSNTGNIIKLYLLVFLVARKTTTLARRGILERLLHRKLESSRKLRTKLDVTKEGHGPQPPLRIPLLLGTDLATHQAIALLASLLSEAGQCG